MKKISVIIMISLVVVSLHSINFNYSKLKNYFKGFIMNKIAMGLTVACATVLMATPASYNKCKGCHGASGEKKALGKSKKEAQQNAAKIALEIFSKHF